MKAIRTYCLLLLTSTFFITHAQKAPKIDLTPWKLTIPEGASTSFTGEKLFDYSENLDIQKYMYNDLDDRSLVFYVSPVIKAQKSMARTELKEQNSFGVDAGWTFKQGATLKSTLKMDGVSKKDNNYTRVVFAQIGCKIKQEQVTLIGATNRYVPAVLKIYWDNGYIKLRFKRIASPSISGNDLLKGKSWIDDDGFTFKNQVGFDKFTLQIVVKEGKMEVSVDGEKKVYSGDDYQKLGIFDNHFSVGCDPQGAEAGTSAKVKFYTLEVSH
jgi:hypothetical protein